DVCLALPVPYDFFYPFYIASGSDKTADMLHSESQEGFQYFCSYKSICTRNEDKFPVANNTIVFDHFDYSVHYALLIFSFSKRPASALYVVACAQCSIGVFAFTNGY